MITAFKEYTYGEARYEVLKELDTRGSVGHFLLKRHAELTSIVEDMCRTLEEAMSENFNIANLGNMALNVKHELQQVMLRLPSYLILESHYDWGPFLSAFCLLITNYLNAEELFYQNCDTNADWVKEDLAIISFVREQLSVIERIVNIGAGYMELLQASSLVVSELKTWQDTKPQSMRLSQLYLNSLGITQGGQST